MSFEPDLHLGNLHLLVDHTATHPDTGPGNGGRPGPCNDDQPTVAELCARNQRTVADLWAAIEQSRRARGADTELREVA